MGLKLTTPWSRVACMFYWLSQPGTSFPSLVLTCQSCYMLINFIDFFRELAFLLSFFIVFVLFDFYSFIISSLLFPLALFGSFSSSLKWKLRLCFHSFQNTIQCFQNTPWFLEKQFIHQNSAQTSLSRQNSLSSSRHINPQTCD